jgi:chromosome segregation ATPase
MSTSAVSEQPEKKRAELENEWALLEQKMQAMKEEMRKLDERMTAKLEEKVKARRAAFKKLESQKKDMENRLKELEENQESSLLSNEPISGVAEEKEESPSARVFFLCCGYCGTVNQTGAIFCENCGKKIG